MQAPPAAKPPAPKLATPRMHRVDSGETLTAIARRYQCDLKALIAANALQAPRYSIRPGQMLRLDGCGK